MKGYRDPRSTVIQDWKWKPLRKVQEKFNLTEIPSHVEKFGEFMDETARRAAEQGLTPRDLVKAYTLTRFSIQRTARKALILRKAGLALPSSVDDQDHVRPEGAFGHWLHTKHGQKYLDEAEAGRVDEEAIADAQQKLRAFGKVDKDLPDALRWAPKNLPGQEARVSELVRRSMKGQSDPSEWRNEMRGLRGIRSAKAGFIAAQLGRGDQPTLDARQIVEHTGQPSKAATKYTNRSGGLGATEAVQRLAARQTAMDLKLPKEMQPNYQHLAHHAFWDAAEGEQTTHQDVMDALRTAKDGGRITRATGGRSESSKIPLQEHLLRAMEMAGFGRDAEKLRNRDPQQVMQALEKIHTPFSDSPESREKAKDIVGAYRVTTDPRLVKDNRYYGIQHAIGPKDVTETVKPIRGVVPKDKVTRPWQHLYSEGKGGTLIGLGGDRTRQGMLTHINGKKLAWPVRLDAGMDYMRELNPGAVWKSAPGATTKLQNKIKEAAKTGPVYGAFSPMGATSGDSSVHMFETLMAQMPDSGMSAATKKAFDKALKAGAHVPIVESKENSKEQRAKAIDIMKKWPGLANPREAAKFAAGLSGEHRALIVKHMDNKTWHERGMPHVGITRVAITEPELRETPGNTIGPRIVRFDPDRIAEETRLKHGTYRGAPPVAGTYWGDTAPLQSHHVMPDPVFERMMTPTGKKAPVIAHPFSEDAYGRGTWDKIRQLHNPVQPINEQWADSVGAAEEQHARYGFADGGEVDDPAAQPLAQTPTPGMGHNQPPEAMPPAPASYIKPVDEDRRRLSPLGFYSHAAEAVWKQPQMKASPQQFKSLLLNKHGVKPDEFKWSGYDEAFKDRPMVSKKEVRDHFIKNLPNIQESMKADHENEYGDKYSRHPDDDSWEETKYSDYQLPGGKNYRELVLHMPKTDSDEVKRLEAARKAAYDARGKAAQEKVRASAAANEMFSRARSGASDEDLDAVRERATAAHVAHREATEHLDDIVEKLGAAKDTNHYRSSHWDEKNPLLHLRVSDRDGPKVTKYYWQNNTSGNMTRAFDSEEEAREHLARLPESLHPNLYLKKKDRPQKILHVEEMQSDWGQDARDKGFAEDREARKQQVFEAERRLNVAHQLGKPDAEKAAAQAELDKLLDAQAEEKGGGVPSAPYIDKTGKWTDLGLKRVLHEAAAGNYDRVVFTPGSEQAKRYDLTNHISDLMVQDVGNNRIDMSYRQHGAHDFSGSQEMHPKELGNHIGKELADKIMAQKPDAGGYRHMSGLDLKVGGEGMKGFYDNIVPKALEKLAKQHDPDARVQLHSHKLISNTRKSDKGWEQDKTMLHALDITPKMRNSIRKGQRAYAGGGRVGKAGGGGLDMGKIPYSPDTPDVPGGTAQRGKDALGLIGSGGGGDAPVPGSGQDFMNKLANDPNTDGMTRLFAAGMAKSGTFSGQDPSKPEPAVVDPNAKPDYPVNRADGGAVDDPTVKDMFTVDPASIKPAVDRDDYQRQVSPIGLYSHAAEAVWKQPQMKASPQQFKATLINKHGVKPDEFKWTGYDQAFDGRSYVTKREVRDHFQQNMPQVQESVRKESDYGYGDDDLNQALNQAASAPKYGQWQLPGGQNYREVLLHLPEQKTNAGVGLGLAPGAGDNVNYHTQHWDVPNVLAHLRMSDRTEDPPGARWQIEKAGGTWQPKKILHVEEVQSDWGQEARDKGIKIGDPDRRIDELEAELKRRHPLLDTLNPDSWQRAWEANPDLHAENQKLMQARNGVAPGPFIDTTDKWTDLALKRVLHEAATGGYDKIVFTNGKDQAERYDLSKHIRKIEAKRMAMPPNVKPQYSIEAYGHDGNHVHGDYHEADELPNVVGAEMAKRIMEETDKAPGKTHVYNQLDLRTGGEGMKQYYDKQVPKRLEKLARMHDPKADVKLYSHKMPRPIEGGVSGEDIMNDLGVDRDAQDTYWRALTGPMREQHMQEYRRRRANDSYALHALEVTPQMRASILKGQRGFAAGGKVSERINERVYQKVRKVVPVAGRYEEGGKA